jgi:hypothetical protein
MLMMMKNEMEGVYGGGRVMQFVWERRPAVRWWAAAAVLVLVIIQWIAWLYGSPWEERWATFVIFASLQFQLVLMPVQLGTRCAVLLEGVLAVMGSYSMQLVPLGASQLQVHQTRRRVLIRWQEKRNFRKVSIAPFTPIFQEAVVRTLQGAESADPGTIPRTEAEARKAVTFASAPTPGWPMVVQFVSFVLLTFIAYWLNHPAWLLPTVALPFLSQWSTPRELFVLTAEHLWRLEPDKEPVWLPIKKLQLISASQDLFFTLRLKEPPYTEVKLASSLIGYELSKYLKERFGSGSQGAPKEAVIIGKRCTLCGRLGPGPQAVEADGVYICESCSGRVRVQASEEGRGLLAKDQRPF